MIFFEVVAPLLQATIDGRPGVPSKRVTSKPRSANHFPINVAISDSVIELNYGGAVIRGGILVKDGTGGSNVSGSLLWDATNDKWIGFHLKFHIQLF